MQNVMLFFTENKKHNYYFLFFRVTTMHLMQITVQSRQYHKWVIQFFSLYKEWIITFILENTTLSLQLELSNF